MSTKVGTLEIEMAANIARLTEDFARAKNEVNKSVGEIQRSVDRMRADIESHMAKVGAAVNLAGRAFAAMAVVTAGGAMFGSAVGESVKLTNEANALAKTFGITASEASVLNIALGDIYQSGETAQLANKALTKQLVNNEGAFKSLGVATRDQNGNYRSSLDIMLDVNKRLMDFKEGTDRNVEGTKIYGKAWGEVQGMLKLNAGLMEESRKKADELGLMVGQENVQATARYRAAMNDVGDVVSAIKKSIGDALLPVLSQLGEWFSSIGPAAVTVTKGVIGGLVAIFYGLKLVAQEAWDAIALSIEFTTIVFARFANVAMKTMAGDFSGAKGAWDAGTAAIAEVVEKRTKNMVKNAEETQKFLLQLFTAPTRTEKKSGGVTSDRKEGKEGKDKKSKSRTGEFEAELNALKQAHDRENEANNTFFEFSREKEREYWQAILQRRDLSKEERIAIERKYLDASMAIRKEAAQAELDSIRKSIETHHAGSVERVIAENRATTRIGELFGVQSKEYRKAQSDLTKAAEERIKQQEKLDQMLVDAQRTQQLAQLDMERERLGLSKDLGDISAIQELQALRILKEKQFQIELAAEQDKVKLTEGDAIAYQQHLDRLAQIKQKHDVDMAKMANQVIVAQKKEFDTMFTPITSAFEKSIAGIIQGTTTLSKAVKSMAQSILLEFTNMGVKMVTQWVANELLKTQATAVGAATRTSIEQGAASTSMLTSAMTSIKSILNAAWETMANVYKSIAAIPVVGPVMAPAMAMGAFAVVAGVAGNIASSAGGDWMIPSDRMNLVHAQETILPADKSRGLDQLISQGLNGKGGDTIHIHAMDARSFQRFLGDNAGALPPALQKLARQFVKVPR